MKKYLFLSVTGFLGLGVVFYFYTHSESQLSHKNKDVLMLLMTAKQIDTSTERDLLLARNFLTMNYDVLVESETQLEETCGRLRDARYGLYDKSSPLISSIVDEYCAANEAKLADIEAFKSKQSIYRNSLFFLNQIEQESVRKKFSSNPAAEQLARELIEASHTYALLPTGDSKSNFQSLLEKAAKNALLMKSNGFQSIHSHASKILATKDDLDQLASRVSSSEANTLLEKLRTAYFEKYEKEAATAEVFRRLMFGTCILFLSFVMYNTVRLWQAARTLAEANSTLEDRAKEKDRLNASLKEAVETANRASAAKSLFLANMSHELRTPMHGILSFAHFGQQKIDSASKEKLKSYFDEIHDSGSRLMRLLNDLLDLAKLESGKMVYSVQDANLLEVVQSVGSEMSAFAEVHGNKLICGGDPAGFIGRFDKDKIAQVVRNLISNAIKFSESGTPIRVDVSQEGGILRCSVTNKGVGIPQEELSLIFDKFAQSSRTRSGAGGTGLGLAICKEIVEHHSGRIWADSNPSGETKFTFEILQENQVHVDNAA